MGDAEPDFPFLLVRRRLRVEMPDLARRRRRRERDREHAEQGGHVHREAEPGDRPGRRFEKPAADAGVAIEIGHGGIAEPEGRDGLAEPGDGQDEDRERERHGEPHDRQPLPAANRGQHQQSEQDGGDADEKVDRPDPGIGDGARQERPGREQSVEAGQLGPGQGNPRGPSSSRKNAAANKGTPASRTSRAHLGDWTLSPSVSAMALSVRRVSRRAWLHVPAPRQRERSRAFRRRPGQSSRIRLWRLVSRMRQIDDQRQADHRRDVPVEGALHAPCP